ncbi:hypothetical protein [Aquimarina litoralis]|uniref:hypothetical protein n=1 Tax=Aquimarina litoralis TaxID=584605 RepID=UPI001C566CB9|nr:hypothetical protein [Aquimarina litoralis]MBW1295394.1 hypothetical protein [Aquimarina litoralis]
MKRLTVFICLLITQICSSQIDFVKHADLLLSARRALQTNETKKALFYYEQAFAIHNDNSIAQYLNAAKCAAIEKNESSCKKWIIQAIEQKKAPKKSLSKFSDNKLYQNCLESILPNYNTYLANFYTSIDNPMIYFQVQELINRDQVTRKLDDYYLGITKEDQEMAFELWLKAKANQDKDAMEKYKAILAPKIDKELEVYNRKVMQHADSLNIARLIDITKEFGWQKEAHLLLWHQRGTYGEKNWVWSFFKPYIDKEIATGKITPFFWALFEDIDSIFKTGKSIYGYHPGKVDPKTVNIKRRSIGLPELTPQEIEKRNTGRDNGSVF